MHVRSKADLHDRVPPRPDSISKRLLVNGNDITNLPRLTQFVDMVF